MIFLPDKIENFDKFINSPIPIFEKKNFLNNELYDQLAASFPKEDLMTKKEHVGLKVSLNNDCPTFQKVVSNNEPWKTCYDNFNSKKTVFLFLDLIKSELDKIENRKNLKNFFFTSDMNKGFSKNLYKRSKKTILDLFYQSINISFEFSIIKNNCHIPPHCDSRKSILSMMLYFPDKDFPDVDPKEINNLGTNFYEKKKEGKDDLFNGWKSDKLLSEEGSLLFKEYFQPFYKTSFEGNTLYGFIKNEKSWHDFSPFDFKKEYRRKSINININLLK
jgi:hypothetical protein